MENCIPKATLSRRKNRPWLTKQYCKQCEGKTIMVQKPTKIILNTRLSWIHSLHHASTIHTLHWLMMTYTAYHVQIDFPKISSAVRIKSQIDLLASLDTTKSNGPDNISARMLKATASSITPSVAALFNLSLRSGRIPQEWKGSRVVPIPNTSVPKSPDNYCPISLLSVLSKALERHVNNLIASHLETNPLSDLQWGFRFGRSTVSALLIVVDETVERRFVQSFSIIAWKRKLSSATFQLNLNNCLLDQVDTFRYFGILLSCNVSWSPHIAAVCSKARQVIGLLYGKFYPMASTDTLTHLYTRPL